MQTHFRHSITHPAIMESGGDRRIAGDRPFLSSRRRSIMDSAVRSLLIWRIFTSLLEQASLVAVILWGLPWINVHFPVWTLVPTSIALTIWNVYTYKKASQALSVKPVAGLADMIGTRGEVVGQLNPSGQVKIRGELWAAETESGEMKPGKKVVVIGQNGLRLTVRETCRDESTGVE